MDAHVYSSTVSMWSYSVDNSLGGGSQVNWSVKAEITLYVLLVLTLIMSLRCTDVQCKW